MCVYAHAAWASWAFPMLRTCWRVIALTVVGLSTAQAADRTVTLACQGTVTVTSIDDAKAEPVPMGLVVNFTTRTVQGASRRGPCLFDDQLQINEWNSATR